jgi:hypothetical protein
VCLTRASGVLGSKLHPNTAELLRPLGALTFVKSR